jgi:hypothetical protein
MNRRTDWLGYFVGNLLIKVGNLKLAGDCLTVARAGPSHVRILVPDLWPSVEEPVAKRSRAYGLRITRMGNHLAQKNPDSNEGAKSDNASNFVFESDHLADTDTDTENSNCHGGVGNGNADMSNDWISG